MTHYGGCALLYSKDTFYPNIDVKSIYFHDTRRDLPDQVTEEDQGWFVQVVLSRASCRRPPVGCQHTFTVMSLHHEAISTPKRTEYCENVHPQFRAITVGQQIDLVAGDFHGTAWRRSNRDNISTVDEAFADCASPSPPGPTPLWRPGSIPNNWADVVLEGTHAWCLLHPTQKSLPASNRSKLPP